MAKVISIDKTAMNYNGDDWQLDNYPPFAQTDNAEEWLGVDSISLERAKELAFELGGDEAYDIEDEINSATDLDELQDALSELKYFQRDNTYNSSWWGGVVDFGVLTEDGEGYGKGLVLLRMHGGGDPRGNYYDMKAFELDSFIEDFPPYFARLTYYIKTDEGDLVLDTDDMEGYTLNVVSDETGTYEEGDYVKIDEIEDAFDMDGNSFYGFGGGVAIGGLLGAYLGYKIGRARPQKKGFSTEKRVGRNIKSALTNKKYKGGGDVETSKAQDIKNGMYKAFEMFLFKQINEKQLISKLQRLLGSRRWFRYYQGDNLANDVSSVKLALEDSNRNYELVQMEMALEMRDLQIYDSYGKEMFDNGGGVSNGDTYVVTNKFDKNYNKVGVPTGAISKDRSGEEYVTLNFGKGNGISTYSISELKKQYKGGGGVQGVVWDKDSDSIRTELGEFRVRITPQSQKGYYDVYVSAYNKKVGGKYDVYGLDKAKDVAYEIIGNANKQYAQGGDVPMNIGVGSRINFIAINGDTREGLVTRKIDDNHWEVSHNLGIAMVGNNDIIGLAGQGGRKKLFGIFEGGGDVNSMSEEDAKRELEELKRQGKITLSIGNHGLVFMQIVKTNTQMVSDFMKSYESYADAFKHYLRIARYERYDNGGDVRNFSWYQDFKPKNNRDKNDLKIGDSVSWEQELGGGYGKNTYYGKVLDIKNDVVYIDHINSNMKNVTREVPLHQVKKEYARGGNVNTGRSWHLDRARHNKRENYEIPMNSRKKRYDNGGGVSSSWYNRLGFGNSRKSSAPMNESLEDYKKRIYAMSNDELAREYARVYTDESKRDVLQKLNEESYLYKPMYLYHLELHHKVESRKNKFGGGGDVDDLIPFTIPTWAVSSLINGDDSGLEDEEIEKIENFVRKVSDEYGNAMFMLGDDEEMEGDFSYSNDIDNLGSDVVTLYIMPSNEYAKGGLTEHGLRLGDKIVDSSSTSTTIGVNDRNERYHIVDLDKGERFDNGGNIGENYQQIVRQIENNEKILKTTYGSERVEQVQQEIQRLKDKLRKEYGKTYAIGGNIDDLVKG